jgi:uncharacterized damage-inducible protein DinB
MMVYGAKDLARAFRTVRTNTLKIAEEIPEDKYGFSPAPGARTVAQTLVHIAVNRRIHQGLQSEKDPTRLGANFTALISEVMAEEQKPRNKAEVVALLRSEADAFTTWLDGLDDAFLGELVTLPPGSDPPAKARLEMLLSPKEHEMHHRGQLMVVERLLGITPHLTRAQQERLAAQAKA